MPAVSLPMSREVLGRTAATPGAIALLTNANVDATGLLDRFCTGDWGTLDHEDVDANTQALKTGDRILASYRIGDSDKVWIIMYPYDNTVLLTPQEY